MIRKKNGKPIGIKEKIISFISSESNTSSFITDILKYLDAEGYVDLYFNNL